MSTTTFAFTWEGGSWVRVIIYLDNWSKRKQWQWPNHDFNTENTDCVNTTLMNSKIWLRKSTRAWAVNFTTLTLSNDSSKMHRQWSWRRATASPHGHSKPNNAENKTLTEQWGIGLQDQDYKSRIAWRGEFHVSTNIFTSRWVHLYSPHCNNLNQIILNYLHLCTQW